MRYSSIRVEIKFTATTTASNTGAPKTIETLRSRFGHFTGNDKLRFAEMRNTSARVITSSGDNLLCDLTKSHSNGLPRWFISGS